MRLMAIALAVLSCGGGAARSDAGIKTLDPKVTVQLCLETYDYCQPSPVGLRCFTVCEPR